MEASLVGAEVSGYRIDERLASAHAELYLATHPVLDGRGVVKAVRDEASIALYTAAIAATRSIRHPNLIELLGVGRVDGALCVVGPYFPDGDLGSMLARSGPLKPGDVTRIVDQLARALDALHDAGVVHRDVKPSNVLLGDPRVQRVVLADLGVATRIADSETGATHLRIGTVDFAAPEQFAGDPLDARADVYALAGLAYVALCGSVPIVRDSMPAALYAKLNELPPAPSKVNQALGPDFDEVLLKGLAVDPDQRFFSAGELALALRRQPGPGIAPAAPVAAREPIPAAAPSSPGPPPPPPPPPPAPAAPAAAQRPDWASITEPGERPDWASTTQVGPGEGTATGGAQAPLDDATLTRLAAGAQSPRPRELAEELVDCSVFAPGSVARGATALVQVFFHRPAQAADAAALATEFDTDASRRGFRSLACPIAMDETLAVELNAPGCLVDTPAQNARWNGRAESVQFLVEVPARFARQSVMGAVTISRQGVPVGHIKFKLTIAVDPSLSDSELGGRGDEAQLYRRAFISYASPDRAAVLERVQVLSALGIGYFHDVLDLEPGRRWELELYRQIDDADLFLLFWSQAARDSTWVRREVDYALRRKADDELAPPEIRPVIVEGPPVIEPWPELAHLHFNDRALLALAATRAAPTPAANACLVLCAADHAPIALAATPIEVGRDPACDMVVDHSGVSRRHARVTPVDARSATVEDLGSRNGTRINGRAVIGPGTIAAGDEIGLGDFRISVQPSSA